MPPIFRKQELAPVSMWIPFCTQRAPGHTSRYGAARGVRHGRVGLGIGLAATLATTWFLESFLFRMTPNDPLTLAGAAAFLLIAALAAGYAPARRASRIDPWIALRDEQTPRQGAAGRLGSRQAFLLGNGGKDAPKQRRKAPAPVSG